MKLILQLTIPVHTVSESNCFESWRKKHARHKNQKTVIWVALINDISKISLPCHIKLTRIGKRLLDTDNLPVSMKWIRDQIADMLIPGLAPGRADNDPRITWNYDQSTGKDYAVIVSFFTHP